MTTDNLISIILISILLFTVFMTFFYLHIKKKIKQKLNIQNEEDKKFIETYSKRLEQRNEFLIYEVLHRLEVIGEKLEVENILSTEAKNDIDLYEVYNRVYSTNSDVEHTINTNEIYALSCFYVRNPTQYVMNADDIKPNLGFSQLMFYLRIEIQSKENKPRG